MSSALLPVGTPAEQLRLLQERLRRAQHQLGESERELAEEQAAVNRFRMHCRLKIGRWVDDVLDLRTEKQRKLTHLLLLQQAEEMGVQFDEDDPFWQDEAEQVQLPDADDDLLLPTDTPFDKSAEKRLYRQLVRRFHPDAVAGSAEKAYATTIMVAVNRAYENHDIQSLRDLAGEIDPELAAELQKIDSPQLRKLQKRIMQLKRQRRKALHQLNVLRQENTAILWRKAERIEAAGQPWWQAVRGELKEAIDRMRRDIAAIEAEIAALEPEEPTKTRSRT